MGYKLFCDKCRKEISDGEESIKIDAKIFSQNRLQKVWKYYHVDCFNYEFSTNIRKLAETEK